VTIEHTYRTDAVKNDTEVTGTVLGVLRDVLGEDQVFESPSPVAASDDVSIFLNRVPGCYLLVGGAQGDGSSGHHHSPTFSVDEQALRIGATALATSALTLAQPG
ncbi:MAG: M20/M25/M40 family metallo-hydrolase, partial [Acidimicrobiales bacterium]